jgi:hypothetical protein
LLGRSVIVVLFDPMFADAARLVNPELSLQEFSFRKPSGTNRAYRWTGRVPVFGFSNRLTVEPATLKHLQDGPPAGFSLAWLELAGGQRFCTWRVSTWLTVLAQTDSG